MIHHYLKPRTAPGDDGSWNIRDLLVAYQWPSGLPGRGRIAIIELGGAYLDSDTAAFCMANAVPVPNVAHVYLDGAAQTTMADDASSEVALDVQVAAAAYSVATGVPAEIMIFWTKDIATGVVAATAAGFDVCSISWGDDEAQWPEAEGQAMERAIEAATAAGMIVFVASGDNDSSDGGSTAANVDLPAGCPHAIACGGTSKTPHAEVVWNNNPGDASGSGTGGGFSTIFQPVPLWQIGAPHGPGRMVPDVAANADSETGYNIVVNGQPQIVGGTSAVAPLYAGLFAAFGEKLGWIGPALYLNALAFTDIIQGDNGLFRAGTGPDPCTGLGAPIGVRLAKQFAP